jgi:hypothetical protein
VTTGNDIQDELSMQRQRLHLQAPMDGSDDDDEDGNDATERNSKQHRDECSGGMGGSQPSLAQQASISLQTTPVPPDDDINPASIRPDGGAATAAVLEGRVAELELVVLQQHQLLMGIWGELQSMRAERGAPLQLTSPKQQSQQRRVSELVKLYEAMSL